MQISPTLRERFESRVSQELTARGCREWLGCLTNGGYGQISIATGISRGAHVVAWFLDTGEWPTAILHECDNRKCTTVAHMIDGTKALNNKDTAKKRRYHYGEDHHKTTLANALLPIIKARRLRGEKLKDLAREFGTSETTVSRIARGRTRA